MKKNIYKILKASIIILCLVGIGILAFFPFPNRGLTVKAYSEKNKLLFKQYYPAEQIKNTEQFYIELTPSAGQEIYLNTLNIYGMSKSTVTKVIGFDALSRMIDTVNGGKYEWSARGLLFKKTSEASTLTVRLNDQYGIILKRLSKSLLQERLMLAGVFTCIMLVLYIIVKKKKKKSQDTINNHSFIFEVKKFFRQLKKYKDYIFFSARADLNAEVANSYLNRLWWLLEPLFNMLVYVIVFGRVMGASIQNYATFVFSALLMWGYFSKTINYSVKLVRTNRDIVTKVYVPKFVLLLSNMVLNFLKLMFSLTILVVMLLIFRVHIGFNIIWVIPAYILMIVLSFGVGMIFLHYGVYVDDLAYAVNILLTMLMFLSGIFYNVPTALSEPLNILMMTFNPMALFVDIMRNALLYNMMVDLPLLGIWMVGSLLLCYIGIHIVYKNENSYVKIV